jgi:hypothetical protein
LTKTLFRLADAVIGGVQTQVHYVKRLSSYTLLITVLVSGLILVFAANFGVVQASTDVSGIIGSDTKWIKASSPYSLTGNTLVGNGVTLTIEAGVTVNLNDYYIMVNGTLHAQGSETEHIQFNGGEIAFTEHGTDWDEQTGSGCVIENAQIHATYVKIGSVSVKISKSNVDAEISGSGYAIISNNTISGKVSGKIVANNTITGDVNGNTVSNNTITGTVSGNVISNNTIRNGEISAVGSITSGPVISNNIITECDVGISCNGYSVISGNNISGCGVGIGLYVVQVLGGTAVAHPLIERNLITHNTRGITIILSSRFEPGTLAPTIQNNTIAHNAVGIYVHIGNYDGIPTIIYNNIHDNSDYNIQLAEDTEKDINATYNWWGTTDVSAINQSIYDFKNDFYLGTVNFVPFLTEPNPEEMSTPIPEFQSWIILPLFLTTSFVAIIAKKRLPQHFVRTQNGKDRLKKNIAYGGRMNENSTE